MKAYVTNVHSGIQRPIDRWAVPGCAPPSSLSLSFLSSHSHRIESSQLGDANEFITEMAGEQVELGQKKKRECSVLFSICLCVYLSDLSIYFSTVWKLMMTAGLLDRVWCTDGSSLTVVPSAHSQ